MKFTALLASLFFLLSSTVYATILLPPPGFSTPALSKFKFEFEAIPWSRSVSNSRIQKRKVYTEKVDVALQRLPVSGSYPAQLISLGTLNAKTGFTTTFALPNTAPNGKYYLIAIEHWVIPTTNETYSLNVFNQTFVVGPSTTADTRTLH